MISCAPIRCFLDATDDPIHGQQEGRFFHDIFSGEHLLCARLRCSNRWGRGIGGGTSSAGFGRSRIRALGHDLLRWCEDHHVDYVMGLANNDDRKNTT